MKSAEQFLAAMHDALAQAEEASNLIAKPNH
jgi:hypothetical protein